MTKTRHSTAPGSGSTMGHARPKAEGRRAAGAPPTALLIEYVLSDVAVVDDARQVSLGRPWILLAMDWYTRAVAGAAVSFERNATAVARCIADAVKPDANRLRSLGVGGERGVQGPLVTVELDCAEEEAEAIKEACAALGIIVVVRPMGRPFQKADIERLAGALAAGGLRELPGSASPGQGGVRGDSPAMTLGEFQAYLVGSIVDGYNRRVRPGFGMSPPPKLE